MDDSALDPLLYQPVSVCLLQRFYGRRSAAASRFVPLRVHTILVGTANPENLKENVKWLEAPLDRELLAEVQKILAPIKDKTWVIPRQVTTDEEDPCRE